jgi:mobilome CxxCx(11)CxxC protein
MNIPNSKRRECNDSALHCFGTAYIFEKRAKSFRFRVRFLLFLGIAGPASVGAIISSFKLSSGYIEYVLFVAAIIAIVQLVGSVWSLVSRWDDDLSYYVESKSANYRLSDLYSKLANSSDLSLDDYDRELRLLNKESQMRTDLDHRYDISDKEKRMGMRAGLRQCQRPCEGCKKIPTSLKPTKCAICGNP